MILWNFLINVHILIRGFAIPANLCLLWLSARSISIGQLNISLHLHLRPINHIVYVGPYQKDILS